MMLRLRAVDWLALGATCAGIGLAMVIEDAIANDEWRAAFRHRIATLRASGLTRERLLASEGIGEGPSPIEADPLSTPEHE